MYINTKNKNWQQELINQQIELYVKQVRKNIVKILLDAFEKQINEFYGDYDPDIYVRDYSFYDLPYEIEPEINGNSVTIIIGLDEKKIKHTPWNNKGYSGVTNDLPFLELITNEFLHGLHGGAHPTNKNMIENIINNQEIFNKIVNEVKDGFSKAGYIVKV